jgi:hypothetical protein
MRPIFVIFISLLLLACLSSLTFAATMGLSTDGDSSFAASVDMNYGSVFTAPSSFTATYISVRILTPSAYGQWFACIYDVNGSDLPINQISSSAFQLITSNQWNTIAIPAVALTAGTRYMLLVAFQNPQTVSIQTVGGPSHEKPWPPRPNPFGNTTTTYGWSMACYTGDVIPTSTPTITSTHTPTYTTTPTPTHTPTYSATPTFTSTHSPTITQTTTPTYTSTVTPTYTITQTSTSSPTPTITQTITLTITATPTLSPSATSTDVPFKLDHDKIMAYPMPARGDLMRFYVYTPAQSTLTIEIFNIIGEKGETITTDFSVAGYQRIPWDISGVAPGIYLYRATLQSQEGMKSFPVQKIVIVKQP